MISITFSERRGFVVFSFTRIYIYNPEKILMKHLLLTNYFSCFADELLVYFPEQFPHLPLYINSSTFISYNSAACLIFLIIYVTVRARLNGYFLFSRKIVRGVLL